MTPVIEVTGLTKRYGGQAVVDGICFHVERGEIFGILGPNGAGKTTAVECMEGLRRRDAGQVQILGLIAELAEANQRLEGIMAENTGLQAQLLTQAREAGAGDERQRMAREIHDTLAQGLTGIITQLEAAQQTASEPERERRIDNAKRLARDSLAEARRSVQALRPQALEDSKLPDALADEVTRWTATSGVPAKVGTTGDPRVLHPEVEALRPDVVLMDLRMPELDGVSAIRALAQRGIDARVLVLTTFDTDTDVLPAIEAGATGYLLKDSPPEELRRGVRAAARGEAVLSPSVATRLVGQVREPAREPLSQRELDILGLIARGCSNREAAARLFISEATVKTHVLHIYAKLGVNDRAAAVAAGFERGLLPRP
jgi:DNA-binding NarL/FixJ family response regulator